MHDVRAGERELSVVKPQDSCDEIPKWRFAKFIAHNGAGDHRIHVIWQHAPSPCHGQRQHGNSDRHQPQPRIASISSGKPQKGGPEKTCEHKCSCRMLVHGADEAAQRSVLKRYVQAGSCHARHELTRARGHKCRATWYIECVDEIANRIKTE